MTIERPKSEKFESVKGLRTFYIRHAQKDLKAGEEDGRDWTITERGFWEAAGLGQFIQSEKTTGRKSYWSGIERTKETAGAVDAGMRTGREKIYDTVKRTFLDYEKAGGAFGKMLKLWGKYSDREIERILKRRGIKKKDFESLDNDIREEIENESEEPFMEEWLEDPNSEPVRTYPPQIVIDRMAPVLRKDVKMAGRLKDGSYIDLLKTSHKGLLEPLLMRILVLPNGKKPEKLAEIGGSFQVGEGYSVEIEAAASGQQQVRLYTYRRIREKDTFRYVQQEFTIDLNELNELADDAIKKRNENE